MYGWTGLRVHVICDVMWKPPYGGDTAALVNIDLFCVYVCVLPSFSNSDTKSYASFDNF